MFNYKKNPINMSSLEIGSCWLENTFIVKIRRGSQVINPPVKLGYAVYFSLLFAAVSGPNQHLSDGCFIHLYAWHQNHLC